ncbi:unnamed protein product [Auanema sp. JU1783]|nr:unnamed protein product [Auanema sp. JU1783]
MDMYFYYKSITDVSLYNCSSLTSEEMNNMRAVRRPIRGVSSIVFGFSMAIVYVLCLHAMLQPKLASKACYKLMFCLGLYDLFAVIGTDFFQGYNLTVGSFFCDAPNLYYVFGCLHMMCWAGASYFCLYLAFNRVIAILKIRREIIDFFFSPSRTMFGCIVGVLYSFFYLFFQTPVLYSNIDGCIVPDPLRLLGKVSFDIRFRPLMANNYGIIVATFTLYGAFYIIFYKNVQRLTDGSYNHSYLHHQVFKLLYLHTHVFLRSSSKQPLCAASHLFSHCVIHCSIFFLPWLFCPNLFLLLINIQLVFKLSSTYSAMKASAMG